MNQITGIVLDAFIRIHTTLGPGLFESVYEEIGAYELNKSGLYIERQKAIPVIYDNIKFDDGFRTDLVVEKKLIIEIKSVESLAPVHFKQVMTYLKLMNRRDGILVNFNVNLLKDGFHRVFNNHVK
ncbi:MAG TPA: GxxExxY protein [Chitinophagaceae bacterium]|nr:GxxExxY protein [Chitinophagaceae bacterium]